MRGLQVVLVLSGLALTTVLGESFDQGTRWRSLAPSLPREYRQVRYVRICVECIDSYYEKAQHRGRIFGVCLKTCVCEPTGRRCMYDDYVTLVTCTTVVANTSKQRTPIIQGMAVCQ